MTELINKLYYLVEDWAGQYDSEEESALIDQQIALQSAIIRRLGEGGEDLLEAYADVGLKLETIHDQALFRAAMQLGTEIVGGAALAAGGTGRRSGGCEPAHNLTRPGRRQAAVSRRKRLRRFVIR